MRADRLEVDQDVPSRSGVLDHDVAATGCRDVELCGVPVEPQSRRPARPRFGRSDMREDRRASYRRTGSWLDERHANPPWGYTAPLPVPPLEGDCFRPGSVGIRN